MQVPFPEAQGACFSTQWSSYAAGMLCVVGSQLEWFRGVLSHDGLKDAALSSDLEKRSSGSLPCTSAEYFGGKASGIGRF